MHLPGAHAFNVRNHRHHEERNVGTRDGEVVQHAGVGHLHPGLPGLAALGIEGIAGHIAAAEPLRFVGNAQHLAGFRVELRVRGEGFGSELATEAVHRLQRFQGVWVQHHGWAVFLQRHQFAVVVEHIGVCRATAEACDGGVVREGIAVSAEQRASRRGLRGIAFRLHIAATKIHAAAGKAEQAQVPFTIERNIRQARWVLVVRAYAVEATLKVGGQLAFHFAVAQVHFLPHGPAEALEHGVVAKVRCIAHRVQLLVSATAAA